MSDERFDFDELDPHDGFKIEVVDLPHELSLHLKAQYKGEVVNPGTIADNDPCQATVELVCFSHPTRAARGNCDRLRQALEAVARFLSTGGAWPDLLFAMLAMKKLAPGGLRYDGWDYHSGYPVYDADMDLITYQHTFVAAGEGNGELTPAIVWIEDVFIDSRTLGQVLREVQDEEEGIQKRYDPSAGEEGQLELSDRPDTGPS